MKRKYRIKAVTGESSMEYIIQKKILTLWVNAFSDGIGKWHYDTYTEANKMLDEIKG